MKHTALIVDDEPDIRELLDMTLMRMGISSSHAATYTQAIDCLNKQSFNICLTDMKLPDGNGLDLVKHIQSNRPDMPVAVITAHGNVDIAIESMKAGAFDFISKPLDLERLRALVNSAMYLSQAPQYEAPELLVGKTEVMLKLKQQITKLARSQAPVLITGESGCGKELVARSIHRHGARAEKPFVAVNCGAIPRDLMESEFFGHKKGSFTGANVDKIGLFQAAHGGTLFLDEVADLPIEMQVKLLRAIQEKAIRPIGSQQELKVDVRILSATHKNLRAEIEANRFRQDLFFRINVIEINTPALRERADDIPMLTDTILSRFAKEADCVKAKLSTAASDALKLYSFPGNVRELENALERAFTLCENDTIELTDLDLQTENHKRVTANDGTELHGQPLDEYLEEIERELIIHALDACRWNRTEAAGQLGISFRSLRYRLKKLGLDEQ